jgi:hypothetical protein
MTTAAASSSATTPVKSHSSLHPRPMSHRGLSNGLLPQITVFAHSSPSLALCLLCPAHPFNSCAHSKPVLSPLPISLQPTPLAPPAPVSCPPLRPSLIERELFWYPASFWEGVKAEARARGVRLRVQAGMWAMRVTRMRVGRLPPRRRRQTRASLAGHVAAGRERAQVIV